MGESVTYLFVAYTILWGIIFTYVFSLGKRQGDLKREIDELRRIAEQQ